MDPGSFTEADVLAFTSKVTELVEVTLNPSSTNEDRSLAYELLENFRTTVTPMQMCRVGFQMTTSQVPEIVVAGFHYIEYVVLYNWDGFSNRDEVKERLWNMLQEINPVFSIHYVQESLARVIAEIGKKEWPQLWPQLIPNLCQIAETSDVPLLILRRLVEDIGTLQRVDCPERKNELSRSLSLVAPSVLSTFFKILGKLWDTGNERISVTSVPRTKLVLNSLLPFIEWVDPLLFAIEDRISKLFECLRFFQLRSAAISCILQLVERKVLDKDNKFLVPIMCLSAPMTSLLIQSVSNCEGDINHLCKVGAVATALCSTLPSVKESMSNLIDVIISLLERPEVDSLVSGSFAYNTLLRHIDAKRFSEEELKIIRIIDLLVIKLFQPPCSQDKEEMNNLRSQFSQLLRAASKFMPKMYARVSVALRSYLSSQGRVEKHVWEAVTFIVDATASNVSPLEQGLINTGLEDLNATFNRFDTETDLELKSTILSTVSSLFVFLSLTNQRKEFGDAHMNLLNQIVNGLLGCLTIEDNGSGLRHHVSSLFIKLAAKFPEILAMTFDLINNFVTRMEHAINLLERQSLVETLFIISNVWKSTERQAALIECVLFESDWSMISQIVENTQTLMQIFEDADFQRTKAIMTCNLTILYAVLRRIKVTKGENGEPAPRHPGYNFICPLLPVIFKCVQTFHQLVDLPEMKYVFEMSDSEKSQVLGVANYVGSTTTARNQPVVSGLVVLASIPSPDPIEHTEPKKIKLFVQAISELCYGILGETCATFASSIYYDVPTLGVSFLEYVGGTFNLMNDYRVRTILRNVYRPFLLTVPINFADNVIKPFAQKLFPYMTNRLCERWTAVAEANKSPDEGDEEKEVIESSVLRLLTKEYLELIQRLLERSANNDLLLSNDEQMDMDGNEQTGDDSEVPSRPKAKNPHGWVNELGDVGTLLMDDQVCFHAIAHLSIVGLCWDDSLVSFRAGRCVLLAWHPISRNLDAVHALFDNTLRLLFTWAENESNLDILVRIVDIVFKTFHQTDMAIVQTLLEWGAPKSQLDLLASFYTVAKTNNDKKRKDLIRKLARDNPNAKQNAARKTSWLSGLPKLVIPKDPVKSATEEVNLNGFSSFIHL